MNQHRARRGAIIIGVVCLLGFGLWGWQQEASPSKTPDENPRHELAPSPPAPRFTPPNNPGLAAQLDAKSLAAMRLIQARFNVGDYDKCLAIAEEHLADPKLATVYKTWLTEQLPAILTSAAWLKIQTAACEDAMPLLQRSLRLRDTAEANKGLAICYFKAKRFYDSDNHFKAYLAQNPDDMDMKLLFSDALESLGDYEEAATQLAAAIATATTNASAWDQEEMRKRLVSMRAKAKEAGNQSIATSEHFILKYRAIDHEALVDWTLETLENAYHDLQAEWGLKNLSAPLEVVLYPDDRFRNFVNYSPIWAGALYDGRLRIPVHEGMREAGEREKLKRVLRHELSHAMLADTLDHRRLPAWFSEGFAQLVECQGACRFPGFPATPGRLLPSSFFSEDFTTLGSGEADQAYRQSLYLVLALYQAQGLTQDENPLRAILDSLNKTSPLSSDALLQGLGLNFDRLHQAALEPWNSRIPDPKISL